MLPLIFAFWRICLFRSGPDTLPQGTYLLGLVVAANLLLSTSLLIAVTDTGYLPSITVVVVSLTSTCGLVWLIMNLMGLSPRFHQTATAIIGTDVLLTVFRACLIPFGFSAGADISPTLAAVSTMLLIWNVLIFGFIFHRALNISMLLGGLVAFFVILFSIAISQTAVYP